MARRDRRYDKYNHIPPRKMGKLQILEERVKSKEKEFVVFKTKIENEVNVFNERFKTLNENLEKVVKDIKDLKDHMKALEDNLRCLRTQTK